MKGERLATSEAGRPDSRLCGRLCTGPPHPEYCADVQTTAIPHLGALERRMVVLPPTRRLGRPPVFRRSLGGRLLSPVTRQASRSPSPS